MQAEDVSDDDIISLNVCGEIMAARRSTLCMVHGSLLEAMFSGRWEGALTRDPEGRVFLEFSPKCFRALLNALIFDSMHPGGTAVQELPMDHDLCRQARHHRDLCYMLDYLGLRPTPMRTPVELRASSPRGVIISSGNRVAKVEAGLVGLMGQEALPAAPGLWTRWEVDVLTLSSITHGTWQLLVGVLAGSRTEQGQLADGSLTDMGCYGWMGFNSGCYVFTAGKGANSCWHPSTFQPGDRAALALHAATATSGSPGALALTVSRSGAVVMTQVLQLPILAAGQGWFMHFNMYGSCSIQVSDVVLE